MFKKIKAYSKINFALKIFPKEKCQSKHQIDGLFFKYKKIYDLIYIKKSLKLSITYLDGQKNKISFSDCLVHKILFYLQKKYQIDINYQIVIHKKIPIGSGLGGGSSDAGAIVNYLLRKNKKQEIILNLQEIALEIGSDIPFFLSNYDYARVRYYGNLVVRQKKNFPQFDLILNQEQCSTKEIFSFLEQDKNYSSHVDIDHIMMSNQFVAPLNDLENYIYLKYPQLKKPANEKLTFSGSGSSQIIFRE